MEEKKLYVTKTENAGSDTIVYGDPDKWNLLCKASSQNQGWMGSTKVIKVGKGTLVQVTAQQKNSDGTWALAEALCYVPEWF